MSSKQAARNRSASERAPVERRNEPAPLCSFSGTAVTPVPHAVGMCTPANAVGSRHHGTQTTQGQDGGDGMSSKQAARKRSASERAPVERRNDVQVTNNATEATV